MKCLSFACAASLIQLCASLGADEISASSFPPNLYNFLLCFGVVAFVLIVCYVFYPAYANVECGLNCTTALLAGGCDENDRDNIFSLVIPAYNEEERLPIMLDATLEYLNMNRKHITKLFREAVGTQKGGRSDELIHCEFIIVDDGSSDDTRGVVKSYATKVNSGDTVKLISMHKNSGKGGAVKTGMLNSSGTLCLMVDADGATDIADGLPKVLKGMGNLNDCSAAAVFGSRAHLEDDSCASRSKIRTFLMHSFHFFVKTLCSHRIKDTQCGFKLFNRDAVVMLFTNLHLRRWAFDTELVVIAEKLSVSLSEVGVIWHEIDGSKLDVGKLALALVSLGMLRDMFCVRACYLLGIWKLTKR